MASLSASGCRSQATFDIPPLGSCPAHGKQGENSPKNIVGKIRAIQSTERDSKRVLFIDKSSEMSVPDQALPKFPS